MAILTRHKEILKIKIKNNDAVKGERFFKILFITIAKASEQFIHKTIQFL